MRLVVASWNIGNNINKIPELMKKALHKNNCQIFVLGLQEVSASKIKNGSVDIACDKIATENKFFPLPIDLKNTKRPYSLSTCKGFTSKFSDFGLYMRIYYKDIDSKIIKVVKSDKKCPTGAKGYLAVTLNIKGKSVDLINAHLPFSEKMVDYKKFISKFNTWLKKNGFVERDRILFGDLNSRSLLTKDCMVKDLQSCRDDFDHNYCQLSRRLNALKYNSTLKRTKLKQRTSCDNQLNNCSIKIDLASDKKQLLSIKKLLVNNDFIGNPPKICNLLGNYNEAPIYFLPSYKRNNKSGKFSLKKGRNGRLPGYADRIVYFTDSKRLGLKQIRYNLSLIHI